MLPKPWLSIVNSDIWLSRPMIVWKTVFEDPCRCTMLKTSTGRQVLPVHSQGKEFEVKYEPNMEVFQCCTTVCYRDSEAKFDCFRQRKTWLLYGSSLGQADKPDLPAFRQTWLDLSVKNSPSVFAQIVKSQLIDRYRARERKTTSNDSTAV